LGGEGKRVNVKVWGEGNLTTIRGGQEKEGRKIVVGAKDFISIDYTNFPS